MNESDAKVLLEAAGISVTPERLSTLLAGMLATKSYADKLFAHDYGLTEPSSRFRPPSPR
jgi:hypothetical protein